MVGATYCCEPVAKVRGSESDSCKQINTVMTVVHNAVWCMHRQTVNDVTLTLLKALMNGGINVLQECNLLLILWHLDFPVRKKINFSMFLLLICYDSVQINKLTKKEKKSVMVGSFMVECGLWKTRCEADPSLPVQFGNLQKGNLV